MKLIRKWLRRIILGFVAILILLVVVLYFSLDTLVRFGVEKGASIATGQTTSLQSAKVSILGGSLELSGLDIDNPAGYSKNKLLSMKDCKSSAQISSLLTNDIVIPEIDIDGLDVLLEQNGLKSNLADVLAVSKSHTAAAGGSSAPTPSGRNIHVRVIKLTNTRVHLATLGQSLTIDLGPLEIDDPTNPDGRPMKVADVVSKVLTHVAEQIANNPQIPDALKGSINQAEGAIKDVTNVLNSTGKDLGSKAQGLTKSLGNLFNQNKK
ncbi:MAG TPA: hypothetical protein VM008_09255 [Phycisphaerae bacterium]|nr:hypothetical protein [Phycisphaerae bacterium]